MDVWANMFIVDDRDQRIEACTINWNKGKEERAYVSTLHLNKDDTLELSALFMEN